MIRVRISARSEFFSVYLRTLAKGYHEVAAVYWRRQRKFRTEPGGQQRRANQRVKNEWNYYKGLLAAYGFTCPYAIDRLAWGGQLEQAIELERMGRVALERARERSGR